MMRFVMNTVSIQETLVTKYCKLAPWRAYDSKKRANLESNIKIGPAAVMIKIYLPSNRRFVNHKKLAMLLLIASFLWEPWCE